MEIRDEATESIATHVEEFCGQWFRNKQTRKLLVLAGKSGCGKSHAMRGAQRFATAAASTAFSMGFWPIPSSMHWCQWPEAARSIVDGSMKMWDALFDSIEADLLFIDDIGAESDKYRSGEATDALCQLLSRREKKWTIASTNFSPNEWTNNFDARVADRLWRNSKVCDLRNASSYSFQSTQ